MRGVFGRVFHVSPPAIHPRALPVSGQGPLTYFRRVSPEDQPVRRFHAGPAHDVQAATSPMLSSFSSTCCAQ